MQMIQKTFFSSGFQFIYDSEFQRARQRKIQYYLCIHEPIVGNLGNVQLQFKEEGDGGVGGVQIPLAGNQLLCKLFYSENRRRGGEVNQSHLNND